MEHLLGRYYFISITLHIVFLSFLFINDTKLSNEQDGFDGINSGKVIEKDQTVEIQFEGDKDLPAPAKKEVKENACEHWYGGIGITTNGMFIQDVYKGYPADKAGLMSGDLILSSSEPEILGEPGTILILTIQSINGIVKEVSLERGKICYDRI